MQNLTTDLQTPPAAEEGDPALTEPRGASLLSEGGRQVPAKDLGLNRFGQSTQSPGARIRRILVPVDFSPASTKAIRVAVGMANQCNAALTILHVIDVNAKHAAGGSGPAERLMKRVWEDGSAQMARLAWSLCGQVEAQTKVEEGLPWEEIVGKSADFDLLVLGKNSARAGWKPFSKRTARRVIENAACPVVVVNEE
jgi:universal stress protein E